MRLSWGEYELDEERFELRRAGVRVPVQRKVLELLIYVVRARDRVVLRGELLDAIWAGVAVSEASISRAVLEARRAIGDELQEVLVTVRGRGFRFVLEVVEKTPAVTGIAPADAATDPTFVGRASSITCLRARLEESVTGEGGLVWISGDAGIGKTRLADEFARRARARGATVASATAHETPAAPQFWLWTQITRSYIECNPGPAAAQFLESIAPLMNGATELPEPSRFVLFDTFARFFIAASRERPVVFVLDDVNWADDGSLHLLQFVVREIRHAAVIIVCTYRDLDSGGRARGRAFASVLGECAGLAIPLRGIPHDEIPRFVEVATGSVPSEAFARELHERTGGNPLYLRQVLQTEWAERALSESAHKIATSMDMQQGLVESIRRHVQSISEEARALLTLGAALGREFDFAELALISGLGPTEMLNRLDEGARARIVLKSKGGGYRFAHALVHEVLYKSLSAADRASRHAAIASQLLAHYGTSLDAHLPSLAFHFTRALPGGSPTHALEFSMRAAESEAGRDEHRNAARHWNDAAKALTHVAADDPRHARVKIGIGTTHALAGDDLAARDAFLDATTLARALGDEEALALAGAGLAALKNP